MTLTSTHHVFRMYVPFQDAQFVPRAIEARARDGKHWLAVTNLDSTSAASIGLKGAQGTSAVGETLTADRIDAINTFADPDTVRPYSARSQGGEFHLELPARSVTVVRIEG